LHFHEDNPQVGMVTPKVILPDGAIDLACHRGMPTPWNAFTYFSKLTSLGPNIPAFFSGYHQTYKDFNRTHEIEATAATAVW
jgi:N-acetylglucosaminyl-diphospho-decaprenol L-rhamnosyltransferase